MTQIHISTRQVLRFILILLSHLRIGLRDFSLFQGSYYKNLVRICPTFHTSSKNLPFDISSLYHFLIFYQSAYYDISDYSYNFLQALVTFSLLYPGILLSTSSQTSIYLHGSLLIPRILSDIHRIYRKFIVNL